MRNTRRYAATLFMSDVFVYRLAGAAFNAICKRHAQGEPEIGRTLVCRLRHQTEKNYTAHGCSSKCSKQQADHDLYRRNGVLHHEERTMVAIHSTLQEDCT